MGPAREKLSRCERAVLGRAQERVAEVARGASRRKYIETARAQEREAELACRFGPRARIKTKVPARWGKTAGHRAKWGERVGPAGEKLSRCERAVSGRAQEREAEPACRFGLRAAGVPFRAAR